ncbi:MAG: chemotaxis protein CheW [Wenzhouxiangellaceae bacterium]|nr:chemotaxis protein CheW [Wenzhouxiangellaceae bacterium]
MTDQTPATGPGDPRSSAPELKKGLTDSTQQFLTFVLGGEMYALSILNVKEIIEYGQLTSIPMMPSSIRGVINLRGAVVPVIDMAARFSGNHSKAQRRTCIVIVEVEKAQRRFDIGIMVDAVSEVLEIPQSEIEPAPSFVEKINADFIEGMGKVNGKFVIILNVVRCLSVEDLHSLARISQKGADDLEAEPAEADALETA